MLGNLQSERFQPLLEQAFELVVGEVPIPVTLMRVTAKPRARVSDTARIPFSLILRGPQAPAFDSSATGQLRGAGEVDLQGVFVNRIVPLEQDGAAYYEIIFS